VSGYSELMAKKGQGEMSSQQDAPNSIPIGPLVVPGWETLLTQREEEAREEHTPHTTRKDTLFDRTTSRTIVRFPSELGCSSSTCNYGAYWQSIRLRRGGQARIPSLFALVTPLTTHSLPECVVHLSAFSFGELEKGPGRGTD